MFAVCMFSVGVANVAVCHIAAGVTDVTSADVAVVGNGVVILCRCCW